MKMEKGTHRSMGKKGGTTAGLESGVAEVQKVAEEKPSLAADTRPKPKKHGSIAV